jgi:large subunit ribosomal protein L4
MPEASSPYCHRQAHGNHAGFPLLRQVLNAYHASLRPSCSTQRSRGEVSHSTRKPWRQKGLGRARAGMTSSPLWRGGGRAFPSRTAASRLVRINKRMARRSLHIQIVTAALQGRLAIVESMLRAPSKTRELREASAQPSTMVVVGKSELCYHAYRAARNVSGLSIVAQRGISPMALHLSGRIVITRQAAEDIATMHSLCETQGY